MSTLSRQASITPALDVGSAGPSRALPRRTGVANARAGPSTSNSNVIDLTSSSPPTSHRALPAAAGPSNLLRLPAPAPRRDGLRARAGPNGGRATADVIELSSDEEEAVVLGDSDEEIVVQGARAGPSRPRAAASSSSNTFAARLPSRVAPDGESTRFAEARAAAQRRREAAAAARRAEDDDIYGLGGGGGYGGYGGGGGGGAYYGGGSVAALYQMLAQGVAGGIGGGAGGIDYGALLGYGGDGLPGALQGLYGAAGGGGWGGADRVKKGKKYGVKMSHPQKMEQGFSRDIIELPDPDDPPPPHAKRKKGSKAAAAPTAEPDLLEPVCAACLQPLLLAQSGSQRPWALRCGHVVCGGCIGSARKRVEDVKRKEREIVLGSDDEMGGESDGELKYVGDSSDEEEVDDEAITGRRSTRARRAATTTSKAKSKASSRAKPTPAPPIVKASKGKAKSLPTDVDSSWTTCPIISCGGDKTDLGKGVGEGTVEAAWELFV